MYFNSFKDLFDYQESESEDKMIETFVETIRNILRRHDPTVVTMARGIIELKNSNKYCSSLEQSIPYFLDRLYMNRISIRAIIEQFIGVYSSERGDLFDDNCNILEIANETAKHAKYLCDQEYCTAPQVIVKAHDPEPTIPYIPSHLYHMMFELTKNSVRAVVEFHGTQKKESELPPVTVDIFKSKSDLTIRIADRGGGFPNHLMANVFNYSYSTANPPSFVSPDDKMDTITAPLAGLGYGLPTTRLYARYFGGDLRLVPIDGYGCEAFLYLRVNPNVAHEILPTFNSVSIQKYKNARLLVPDFMYQKIQLKHINGANDGVKII